MSHQQQSKSPQSQYKEIIPSNANDLNNGNANNNNNNNNNNTRFNATNFNNNNNNANNKKQTLRLKQKQNLEIYLKEIGIEIEEEDEEVQQIIDIFVTQKFTPNVFKLATIEDLEKSFEKLKIAIGFQTQLLTAIKASKVKKNLLNCLDCILI